MNKTAYSKEQYFDLVQLEYFAFLLRSKIYDEPFAKISRDIAEMKKKKILSLHKENRRIKCIFDDPCYYSIFLKDKFLNKFGLPNLRYNPKNEGGQRFHDVNSIFKAIPCVTMNGKTYEVESLKGRNCIVIRIEGLTKEVEIKDVSINFDKLFGI